MSFPIQRTLKILSLTDLTRLEDESSDETMNHLSRQINSCVETIEKAYHTTPSAICVHSNAISEVRNFLLKKGLSKIKIATVVNFPSGNESLETVLQTTSEAIGLGADEIDMVFPWEHYLAGKVKFCASFLHQVKQACLPAVTLKVILETGKLGHDTVVYNASRDAIEAGADFIKTSTGKVKVNATLASAKAMLTAINDAGNVHCGFKASGGIRTIDVANQYLELADTIMGVEWVSPQTFRFGASGLLDDIFHAVIS